MCRQNPDKYFGVNGNFVRKKKTFVKLVARRMWKSKQDKKKKIEIKFFINRPDLDIKCNG